MKAFYQKFLNFINKAEPLGFHGILRFVLAVGIFTTGILAINNTARTEMLALIFVFLLALTLTRFGYYLVAGWLTLISAIVITSTLIYQNDGIRDIAMSGLIVILIFAGLLGGRMSSLFVGALIVAEIFILGYLESQGILVNRFSEFNQIQNYFSAALSVVLITGLQFLVISRLNQNVKAARQELSDRKKAEEQLQQRVTELEAMRGASEILIAKHNLADLIEETGEHIRHVFQPSGIFISLYNPKTNMIHFPYDVDSDLRMPDIPIQYGRGLTSRVMEMKKTVVINENWLNESVKLGTIYRANRLPKSSIAVPMMIQERAIGTISIDNTEREYAFSENDVRLLETIAANLAVAIENARLQESMQQELSIQEKLVDELEEKNQELERFAYTASHDLKAPLITIRGYLGYIEKDAKTGNYKRLLQDTQRISEATEKMHRLLNELLEISRVGRIMNKAEEISFAEIVKDALERVDGQIKTHQVDVKIQNDLPMVFVDKERLIEVVQNLVDNAVKFMGKQKNPRVEVGAEKKTDKVFYFVKDNGIGIKKEFHEKIFGLFDKLDGDTQGTGIGLALVKRIIEVHGGKIWVESEEGKGTTFLFTLGNEK
jgi:K+-sensing histidine kinase KdpD